MEETIKRAEAVAARLARTIEELQRIVDGSEWRDVPTTPIPPEMLEDIRRM